MDEEDAWSIIEDMRERSDHWGRCPGCSRWFSKVGMETLPAMWLPHGESMKQLILANPECPMQSYVCHACAEKLRTKQAMGR